MWTSRGGKCCDSVATWAGTGHRLSLNNLNLQAKEYYLTGRRKTLKLLKTDSVMAPAGLAAMGKEKLRQSALKPLE
jgi:hypothetical protein